MPGPSKLARNLESGSFIITCEMDPPRGTAWSLVDSKVAAVKNKIQAIVVSDNPKARLQMAPIGFCRYLIEQGLEPVMTVTCRDRNRLALQSDLLAAAVLGIQNILAVTGDYITWGDHPQSKPVYDLDSVQLIWAISQINLGRDISGGAIEGPAPLFTVGGAVTLTADLIFPQILKCRKKQEAGAHFFVSHPIFDLAGVEEFFKQASEVKIPLLASVCLLQEEQIREYWPGKYPGLLVPESLVDRFRSLNSAEFRTGMIEHTGKLIEAIRKDGRFQGVHLMMQGAEERIEEII
jgi:methylenetetrahydrofolate reductase (NADPH)